MLLDEILDLIDRRDDGMHVLADRKTQILDRLRIQRIHECDLQHVVLVPERERAVKLRKPRRQQLQQFRRRCKILEVHILRTDRTGDALVVALLGHRLVVHEHVAERFSGAGDLLQDVVHHGRIHDSLFDENVQCLSCVHG